MEDTIILIGFPLGYAVLMVYVFLSYEHIERETGDG